MQAAEANAVTGADGQRAAYNLGLVGGELAGAKEAGGNGPGVLALDIPAIEAVFGVEHREAGGIGLEAFAGEYAAGEALGGGELMINAADVLIGVLEVVAIKDEAVVGGVGEWDGELVEEAERGWVEARRGDLAVREGDRKSVV